MLKRECLDRRIYRAATLRSEVAVWQVHRNAADRLIDWQFTIDDARIKLRRLYRFRLKKTSKTMVEATLSPCQRLKIIEIQPKFNFL